ncbi:MAG: chemotaxis protein CheW [Roseiflexaceae bacterium]
MELRQLRSDPVAWDILEERARALMVQDTTAESDQGEEFLAFRLDASSYSIPARFIREVQPLGDCTPLPHTPAFVAGLVNVRGRLIAVLDIRPLLDMPQTPFRSNAFLLILSANGMDVGLLADEVIEVRRSADALMPVLSTTADRAAAWVCGVDRNLNLVLDPLALLADPRLIVNGSSQ